MATESHPDGYHETFFNSIDPLRKFAEKPYLTQITDLAGLYYRTIRKARGPQYAHYRFRQYTSLARTLAIPWPT